MSHPPNVFYWIHVMRTTSLMKPLLSAPLLVLAAICSAEDEDTVNCSDAYSTPDIIECANRDLRRAETNMTRYLEASLNRQEDDAKTAAAIRESQQAWQAYVDAHCGAVWTYWRQGTVRSVMTVGCQSRLTDQRTHTLWRDFLTYMDSTPPILPEPTRAP